MSAVIDLFGVEVEEDISNSLTVNGYAFRPGSGPDGHFCKDCQHLYRKKMSKTYLKCRLMRRRWTGGTKTDVRANSPACKGWVLAERIVQ